MNRLSLLLLLPFFLLSACSDDNDGAEPNNGAELIFNEPLTSMFGKTLEEVKKAETRTLINEDNNTLTYSDKKNNISYNIIYLFNSSILSEAKCQFQDERNLQSLLQKLTESLESKYKKRSNKVTYLSDDETFVIWTLTLSTSIDVMYMMR